MESQKHLAYNQTNECFLGLDVIAADFSSSSLAEWMPALTLNSDAGLWLVPFRGIPTINGQMPIDLIYLDDKCRVIEVVESFPKSRVLESSPRAMSVLVLPSQSIVSSQTKRGDQLVLWIAREMAQRLEQMPRSDVLSRNTDRSTVARTQNVRSSDEHAPQSTNDTRGEPLKSDQTLVAPPVLASITPGVKSFWSTRNRFQRWWSPEPRKAPRVTTPDLTASFWTGASPEELHTIRDVSATGMFLVTGERWCPGTVIRMLLTNKGNGIQSSRHSISVLSRAVRWANEGVGLQFVVQDNKKLRIGNNHPTDGASRKELDEFLGRVGIGSTAVPRSNVI